METYTKLGGEVINLMELSPEHKAFFERCWQVYQTGTAAEYRGLLWSTANPVMAPSPFGDEPGKGYVTREAFNTPLFQALRDLQDRVEIREHLVAPVAGDLVDQDPLADEWISTAQAAEVLGISSPAVHKAIEAGRLISKPAKEGARRRLVSLNSVRAYQLHETNKANGAQGGRPGDGSLS